MECVFKYLRQLWTGELIFVLLASSIIHCGEGKDFPSSWNIGKLQVELNILMFSVTQGDFPQPVLSSKNSKDVGVTCLLKCFPMLSIPLAAEEHYVDEKEGK